MAVPLAMKRMLRERKELEQPNPDYFVSFENDDLLHFDAYILGPTDSLYNHKLVKVHFDVPQNYPMVPPVCKFVQHSGQGRIHPNLYVDGKVCLSILGTWPGEPWAQAMKIDSVLITIRSLLDNSPYRHEPGCHDNPHYNAYVRYATWDILLLDYISYERSPEMKLFLRRYMQRNGLGMLEELRQQSRVVAPGQHLRNRWDRHEARVDYAGLSARLSSFIPAAGVDVMQAARATSGEAVVDRVAKWFDPSSTAQVATPAAAPQPVVRPSQPIPPVAPAVSSNAPLLAADEDVQFVGISPSKSRLSVESTMTKPATTSSLSSPVSSAKRKREPEWSPQKKSVKPEVIVLD